MKKFLRDNSLTLALFALFFLFQAGLSVVGHRHYNQEQEQHNQEQVSYIEYLTTGSFLEVTMENWESEFLQMFAYVLMTAFLFQRGSAESRDPDSDTAEPDPRTQQHKPDAPWPVRKGGIALLLYQNSLSLALFLLFAISFILHGIGGVTQYNEEELAHGGETMSLGEYFSSIPFWFESLQNWQSEFFSIGMLVLLSIVLRQRGSTESKQVADPHSKTGKE